MTAIDTITYAGHSAVFLSNRETTLAIDPWLEGNPRCPPDLRSGQKIDLIVLTHGHSDHASDVVRVAKESGASVAATYELAMLLTKEGLSEERVLPMNKGGTLLNRTLQITLTHAIHSSSFDTSSAGTAYAGEAAGVIIQDGVRAFYHAGDTALFSDMVLIRERYSPEIAFLPIGDRFTMGPQEAAHAAELVGARRVIPIHYGTFEALTGTPAQFIEACKGREEAAGIEIVVMEPGQQLAVA